jgi:hypothetical protein
MSDFKGCDFCPARIDENDEVHSVIIDEEKKDCCKLCFYSPVILAECRRTRTRKAKIGRPRGKKVVPATTIEPAGIV